MSWRQILGVTKPDGLDQTHNTQNPHKTRSNGVSANNEDSVRDESKFMDALSLACSNCSINAMDFYKRLTQEDVQEWFDGKLSVEDLTVAARSFEQQDAMLRGEVPDNYIYHANCKGCGPVWLWYSKEVLGCPWCWVRAEGKPIPRPDLVRCRDCANFQSIDRPHLGHCEAGEPEAIAGLWDKSERYCERFCSLNLGTMPP